MYDEKKMRERILDELYESYLRFSDNYKMQNTLVREMIDQCNWLRRSVGEFLISKAAQQPAPPAESTSSKAPNPFKCPHCERSFKSQKAVDGHQKEHRKILTKTALCDPT